MLTRKQIVILILGAIALGGIIAAVWFSGRQSEQPNLVTQTATPTPNPADAAQVETYTQEFLAKYLTYQNPGTPEYLASIKPFLSDALYADIASGAAAAKAGAPAQRGELQSAVTSFKNPDELTVTVTVQINEAGTDPYTQKYELTWKRQGERWSLTGLKLLESTKKYPYLES